MINLNDISDKMYLLVRPSYRRILIKDYKNYPDIVKYKMSIMSVN